MAWTAESSLTPCPQAQSLQVEIPRIGSLWFGRQKLTLFQVSSALPPPPGPSLEKTYLELASSRWVQATEMQGFYIVLEATEHLPRAATSSWDQNAAAWPVSVTSTGLTIHGTGPRQLPTL